MLALLRRIAATFAVAGSAVAFALAVGLGSRDAVARTMDKLLK